MSMRDSSRVRGFIVIEIALTLALVLGMLTLFALALSRTVANSGRLLARQQAMLAAEAVLNEIREGAPPDPAAFRRRFRHMDVEVHRQDGAGDWDGTTLVTVRVRVVAGRGRGLSMHLSGYVVEPEQ